MEEEKEKKTRRRRRKTMKRRKERRRMKRKWRKKRKDRRRMKRKCTKRRKRSHHVFINYVDSSRPAGSSASNVFSPINRQMALDRLTKPLLCKLSRNEEKRVENKRTNLNS